MNEKNYLTNMPFYISEYGLCKTLAIRREIIHIKHILTEMLVRKSFPYMNWLDQIEMNFHDYMIIMTNRIRNSRNSK